jgi:hypothetical protein
VGVLWRTWGLLLGALQLCGEGSPWEWLALSHGTGSTVWPGWAVGRQWGGEEERMDDGSRGVRGVNEQSQLS